MSTVVRKNWKPYRQPLVIWRNSTQGKTTHEDGDDAWLDLEGCEWHKYAGSKCASGIKED